MGLLDGSDFVLVPVLHHDHVIRGRNCGLDFGYFVVALFRRFGAIVDVAGGSIRSHMEWPNLYGKQREGEQQESDNRTAPHNPPS